MDPSNNQEKLESELRAIRMEIKEIKEMCRKMSGHIDFINKAYTTLRSPLNWITSKFYGQGHTLESINIDASQQWNTNKLLENKKNDVDDHTTRPVDSD